MSNILQSFKDFGEHVIRLNDFDAARSYLQRISEHPRAWRLASSCVRQLMRRALCQHQAARISQILDEFLPAATPAWALSALRAEEARMYERLKSTWGIRKTMAYEIAQSVDGRRYLRSLRKLEKHKK